VGDGHSALGEAATAFTLGAEAASSPHDEGAQLPFMAGVADVIFPHGTYWLRKFAHVPISAIRSLLSLRTPPATGVLKEFFVSIGTKVNKGARIASLEIAEDGAAVAGPMTISSLIEQTAQAAEVARR
jgi:hypothetical protein